MADPKFRANVILNSVLSVCVVFGLTYLLYPYLFKEGPEHPLRSVWQGLAILGLYDFLYYLVHRYPFHAWRLLRFVHRVHHAVRTPTALDSLYLHPVETFLGLALLWGCTYLVALATGLVSIYTFVWVFLIYSLLNIVIHGGVIFRTFPLSIIGNLSRRHDKHHVSMKAHNYASVTPIWDRLLGTEVRD